MEDKPAKSMQDVARHVGKYPEHAFHFVREGLSYSAETVHGKETDAHRLLQHFLAMYHLDWSDLVSRYHAGSLPEPVVEAINAAGGRENLNRHVDGRQLCWGLRDYSLQRWGLLARTVLESWKVTSTGDFGRIVFGFIELDMMQKQADDKLEDFEDVYSFDDAFEKGFHLGWSESPGNESE
ncbi:MAG: hypothetical protein KJ749_07905 [Planctomycetes bacterium]|nr:hypothetical protein [Planctomycetota bacterium]